MFHDRLSTGGGVGGGVGLLSRYMNRVSPSVAHLIKIQSEMQRLRDLRDKAKLRVACVLEQPDENIKPASTGVNSGTDQSENKHSLEGTTTDHSNSAFISITETLLSNLKEKRLQRQHTPTLHLTKSKHPKTNSYNMFTNETNTITTDQFYQIFLQKMRYAGTRTYGLQLLSNRRRLLAENIKIKWAARKTRLKFELSSLFVIENIGRGVRTIHTCRLSPEDSSGENDSALNFIIHLFGCLRLINERSVPMKIVYIGNRSLLVHWAFVEGQDLPMCMFLLKDAKADWFNEDKHEYSVHPTVVKLISYNVLFLPLFTGTARWLPALLKAQEKQISSIIAAHYGHTSSSANGATTTPNNSTYTANNSKSPKGHTMTTKSNHPHNNCTSSGNALYLHLKTLETASAAIYNSSVPLSFGGGGIELLKNSLLALLALESRRQPSSFLGPLEIAEYLINKDVFTVDLHSSIYL